MESTRMSVKVFSKLMMALCAGSVSAQTGVAAGNESPESRMARAETVIMSSSHQDFAWMDDPASCRDFRVHQNIAPALDLMKKDSRYCFVMENMQNLMEFMEDAPERMDEVVKYMKEGRLEFGANT